LLTAVIVAYCGGIGFVGLMVPHIVRRYVGAQSRTVLAWSLVVGGVFIVGVDTVTRVLLTDQELPIGIITAAIGSVFFLFVMRDSTRSFP
jgi:iron complex transport system permease protein